MKGFDKLINNLKSGKNQIDKAFDKQQKENDDDGDEFEFGESLLKSKTNFNLPYRKKNEVNFLKIITIIIIIEIIIIMVKTKRKKVLVLLLKK